MSNPERQGPANVAVVVEDSERFRELVCEAIGALGGTWVTREFATGGDAMAALREMPRADLVLVDLGLPDVGGQEVIRAARLRFPDSPVMVISVLSSSEAVLEAIQLGARGYLQKDDSAFSLSQGIRGVLAGQYPISPSLAQYLFRILQGQASPAAVRRDKLSAREIEFLRLLGNGYTYAEAAKRMDISLHTAQTYSKRIYLKLEVSSKSDALDAARRQGILQ